MQINSVSSQLFLVVSRYIQIQHSRITKTIVCVSFVQRVRNRKRTWKPKGKKQSVVSLHTGKPQISFAIRSMCNKVRFGRVYLNQRKTFACRRQSEDLWLSNGSKWLRHGDLSGNLNSIRLCTNNGNEQQITRRKRKNITAVYIYAWVCTLRLHKMSEKTENIWFHQVKEARINRQNKRTKRKERDTLKRSSTEPRVREKRGKSDLQQKPSLATHLIFKIAVTASARQKQCQQVAYTTTAAARKLCTICM